MYDKSVPVPRRGQYTKVNQEEDDRKPVDISDRRARRQRTLAREAKRKKTIESIQQTADHGQHGIAHKISWHDQQRLSRLQTTI